MIKSETDYDVFALNNLVDQLNERVFDGWIDWNKSYSLINLIYKTDKIYGITKIGTNF